MKNLTALFLFLLTAVYPFLTFGQTNQFLKFQNDTLIVVTEQQIDNANSTRITLLGCIEVVEAYRTSKSYSDSLIPALKASNGMLKNQLSIYQEIQNSNKQNISFLEKSLKKENGKKVANQILFYTFAVSSAALMVLYLTK